MAWSQAFLDTHLHEMIKVFSQRPLITFGTFLFTFPYLRAWCKLTVFWLDSSLVIFLRSATWKKDSLNPCHVSNHPPLPLKGEGYSERYRILDLKAFPSECQG